MKILRMKIAPWLGAVLCLTLASAVKGDDNTTTPPDAQKPKSEGKATEQEPNAAPASDTYNYERDIGARYNQGAPTRVNKASGILGMAVRNQNDESLGHIKDFVVDWNNGQVSYAVISTSPKVTLGMGGKMVAVPLAALTPSPDQRYLILNADKAKMQAATGFDPNNWPSVGNPSWGAQPCWQPAPGSTTLGNSNPNTGTKGNTKPDSTPDSPPSPSPEEK